MNAFSHIVHLCGLILLCDFMWRPKWLDVTNETPHSEHWYGFSF